MTATEVVKKYLGALENNNPSEAFSFFADDVKWYQPGNNKFSGVKIGGEQIGAMIGGMISDTAGNFVVLPNGNLMENGNLVAVPVRFTGKKEDGKTIDMKGLDLFEVKNDKITQVWLFSNDQTEEDEFWGSAKL